MRGAPRGSEPHFVLLALLVSRHSDAHARHQELWRYPTRLLRRASQPNVVPSCVHALSVCSAAHYRGKTGSTSGTGSRISYGLTCPRRRQRTCDSMGMATRPGPRGGIPRPHIGAIAAAGFLGPASWRKAGEKTAMRFLAAVDPAGSKGRWTSTHLPSARYCCCRRRAHPTPRPSGDYPTSDPPAPGRAVRWSLFPDDSNGRAGRACGDREAGVADGTPLAAPGELEVLKRPAR